MPLGAATLNLTNPIDLRPIEPLGRIFRIWHIGSEPPLSQTLLKML